MANAEDVLEALSRNGPARPLERRRRQSFSASARTLLRGRTRQRSSSSAASLGNALLAGAKAAAATTAVSATTAIAVTPAATTTVPSDASVHDANSSQLTSDSLNGGVVHERDRALRTRSWSFEESEVDESVHSFVDAICSSDSSFLDHDTDIDLYCDSFLQSPLFQSQKAIARRMLIAEAIDGECGLLPLTVLLKLFKRDGACDRSLFTALREQHFLPSLVAIIKYAASDAPQLLPHALDLLLSCLEHEHFAFDNLDSISDTLILLLLDLIDRGTCDNLLSPERSPSALLLFIHGAFAEAIKEHDGCGDSWSLNTAASTRNRVFGALEQYGADHRTFGVNVIILLNREHSHALSKCALRLIYATLSRDTTKYFLYTNDVVVLESVIMRALNDLGPSELSMRLCYLRVLRVLLPLRYAQAPLPRVKHSQLIDLLRTIASDTRKSEYFNAAASNDILAVVRDILALEDVIALSASEVEAIVNAKSDHHPDEAGSTLKVLTNFARKLRRRPPPPPPANARRRTKSHNDQSRTGSAPGSSNFYDGNNSRNANAKAHHMPSRPITVARLHDSRVEQRTGRVDQEAESYMRKIPTPPASRYRHVKIIPREL